MKKPALTLGDTVMINGTSRRGVIKEWVAFRKQICAQIKLDGDNGVLHKRKDQITRVER